MNRDGLLLIDKPGGQTSHDIVYAIRRATGEREVGHAGTLDPMATGLLILCVGKAVRLSEYLIGKDKVYAGRMKLGERTNTDDAQGEVVERRDVRVTAQDLERARAALTGDILQVPPQFSAIQRAGRRAYQMARKGEAVDLPPRPVRIAALDLAPAGFPEVELRVACSAGTYIRALVRDIGEMLGCGAHLTALRRIASGSFRLDESVPLRDFQQAAAGGDWERYLLPMERAVEDMPRCELDRDAGRQFLMGQFVPFPGEAGDAPGGLYRVYAAGRFIALGRRDALQDVLKPAKVFRQTLEL